ncbi:glycogen synthase [Hoyosella altamirensis]|uniref:Starch synthase n=1 Tax=Hoyosella altamirensis TaxID=616997 RepID=A0A839RRW6_9ACTN|nr:glycogen synthase [Hoyosella altamirensis]MBB3038856.1 starch synthase [Hoyosella altamirensis]
MRIGLLTREFPPFVYGGAGVHVGSLVDSLRELVGVDVHCFGSPRPGAVAHHPAEGFEAANPALSTLSVDLSIVAAVEGVDLVHSHTWYANFAGHVASLLYGIPHVVTAHSLEPRRPWKAEQLGGGYRLSSWVEKAVYESADAVIAVSDGMRKDVLECYPEIDPNRVHVVYNGVDTERFHPVTSTESLEEFGVDPARPSVAFIGRITRQKGLRHLIAAAHKIAPEAQVLLCAGAPDTPDIAEETRLGVSTLSSTRDGVFWIDKSLNHQAMLEVLSHADVFVCPSVYEPLGIVNLEAMACGTPVVASDVGGIPEVVADGETGILVHYNEEDPAAFEAGLAESVNSLLQDPQRAQAMGAAGRARAEGSFDWGSIAHETVNVYRSVLKGVVA